MMALQIMLVLTQQHDRPDIPSLDTLPGQPLPGIGDYIGLMQVLHGTTNWMPAGHESDSLVA